MAEAHDNAFAPFKACLACRCPRCGEGRLFAGLLAVAERCEVCGLDLTREDSGDGPAVFVIFVIGFVIVGLALALEMTFAPPVWLHMMLWLQLILVGSIGLLRPFKATLIALQYHHRVDFERDGGDE